MSLFNELKRRNVFRVAIAYLISAWVVAQVADLVLSSIQAPSWVMKVLLLVMGLGFIAALIISWAYEITADGIKREVDITRDESITNLTAKKLDTITIFAAIVVIGLIGWQQFKTTETDNLIQVNNDTKPTPSKLSSTSLDSKQSSEIPSKSIAVLPFINRSSNKDDQYFVDGIQDDLLTKLSKIHQMKVVSRTSVMEYRDTTKKIPEIAKELGVANILEGGVQRSGSHVRINAQLIHAATDQHLWAETYDRELNVDNVFAIQTEITIAISKAMEATLTSQEKDQINKPLTDNLIAWELYKKGKTINSVSDLAFNRQIKLLKRAIELDPKFAIAYADLATTEMAVYWFQKNTQEQRQLAWQAIQSSRALDDNTAELFAAEAAYYYWGFRDYTKALQAINKALEIDSNYVGAYDIKGYVLRRMGRFEESIIALDTAASLNPRATYALQENAETLLSILRFNEAEEYIQRIEKISPNNKDITLIKGQLAVAKDGNQKQAIAELTINKEGSGSHAWHYWNVLLQSGEIDQALEFAKTSKQFVSSGFAYNSNEFMTGITYFLKGDKANTKLYLNKSILILLQKLNKDSENKNYLVALCKAYAALGFSSKANNYCQKALQITHDAYDYPFDVLLVVESYAMLNQKQKALSVMKRLLNSEVRPSENSLRFDPFLKNLLSEPEFLPLIKRIGSGELVKSL